MQRSRRQGRPTHRPTFSACGVVAVGAQLAPHLGQGLTTVDRRDVDKQNPLLGQSPNRSLGGAAGLHDADFGEDIEQIAHRLIGSRSPRPPEPSSSTAAAMSAILRSGRTRRTG